MSSLAKQLQAVEVDVEQIEEKLEERLHRYFP